MKRARAMRQNSRLFNCHKRFALDSILQVPREMPDTESATELKRSTVFGVRKYIILTDV